jgi:hypothetical protein
MYDCYFATLLPLGCKHSRVTNVIMHTWLCIIIANIVVFSFLKVNLRLWLSGKLS